jgi:hypothetical protein
MWTAVVVWVESVVVIFLNRWLAGSCCCALHFTCEAIVGWSVDALVQQLA